MSQHLEYMDAKLIEVAYGPETEIRAAEDPDDQDVLSLFVDDGVVITGTPEELVDLTIRIRSAIAVRLRRLDPS